MQVDALFERVGREEDAMLERARMQGIDRNMVLARLKYSVL